MVDPLIHLSSLKRGYEKLDKIKRSHIKLSLVIFLVSMGLVFYFFPRGDAYAQQLDAQVVLTSEAIDPLHKIGQGLKAEMENNFSRQGILEKKEILTNPKFLEMLAGFPMEKMVTALNGRNPEVAAYLIAIAKKESDWGVHSPKRSGKECYNYWGYKGAYRPTASGYSCFDSPEQAITVVGDRLESLLNKGLNTPEKMLVWKCGSSCAGHNARDVQKWVSDVKLYHNKLKS
jgi:hypothetical protein